MPYSNYKRIREIGSGSFGHAYLVQAKESLGKVSAEKHLVMKEIDLSGKDAKQKSACELEVKVLAALKHPYIVRYYESFMNNHNLCIVMDYCEGGDLWQYIQQWRRHHQGKAQQPIPEVQVVRWLSQLGIGLKYMHEKNVLHRDIKTQNIFLTKHEGSSLRCVKIADFGIAKVLKDSNALAHTQVGTPYYLSPEICQRQPYACPSDIWALGCVIFELCALRVPFEAQDLGQLVSRIVSGSAPRVPGAYSRELSELVGELLNKDAHRRPTASAILQRPFIQGEIKKMLAEKQASVPDGAGGGQERGAAEQRAPSVQRHHERHDSRHPSGPSPSPRPPAPSVRGASPSAVGRQPSDGRGAATPRHREASPQRRSAAEVLRPSRAPSKGAPPHAASPGSARQQGSRRYGGA